MALDSMHCFIWAHRTISLHSFFLILLLLSCAVSTSSESAFSLGDASISHSKGDSPFNTHEHVLRLERILQEQANTTENEASLNETATDAEDGMSLNETGADAGGNSSDTGNFTNFTDVPSPVPNESLPLESYGPFEVKYIYLVFYDIIEIPDPDEWAAVTEKYLTSLFEEDGGSRVENPEITIEFVRQLGKDGDTEVLYIQTISYDSRTDGVIIDEFVMGPFYLEENRKKYVQMLKESDSVGYAGLTDTSIAQNLGDLDLTPLKNNLTTLAGELTNNTMLYVGAGVGGGLLLICCCCCCLCFIGVLGWNMMSSSKPGGRDDFDDMYSDDDMY